jgi:predicted RNase H-like HicB family nuclease
MQQGTWMNLKVLTSEGEDGWLVVQCPSILGCISQGRNLKEAIDNIKEAIEGCLEVIYPRIYLYI